MFSYFLFASLVIAASATDVKPCTGTGKPFPHKVDVIGCEKQPCNVYKGKTSIFDVDFTAPNAATKLETKIRATAFGLTINYDLPDDIKKTCDHLKNGAYCPIDANEDVSYQFQFPVGSIYPEIGVNLEISVVDENKNTALCFTLDIQVKSG